MLKVAKSNAFTGRTSLGSKLKVNHLRSHLLVWSTEDYVFLEGKIPRTPIWYEDFVPDITQITEIKEVARAGYLLEKLMTFHCVTRPVRSALRPTVDELIRKASNYVELLPMESILNLKQFSGDGLALRWRLQENIHLQVQDLLPYQVRTYSHN